MSEKKTELPFDSKEFADAWESWIDHKKEIRQKLPTTTIEIQLKRLKKWGEQKAIESIENSIASKWQGLFEPKNQTQGQPSPRKPFPGHHETIEIPYL